MKAFTFVRPTTIEDAVKAAAEKGSVIKAGGIDLLDRMKERVDEPDRVVGLGDVDDRGLREIRTSEMSMTASPNQLPRGPLRIGALATLHEIATSDLVRRLAPALSEAAASAASPQLRHRATLAGNLLQHTRCGYYRHRSFPCLKRGDDACPVLADGGVQDTAAIFGNRACASAHPSSLAPVLAACRATVVFHRARSAEDEATLPIDQLYAPPARGRGGDTVLAPGDVIVGVHVPIERSGISAYEEVRQKAAFDWALVSCAVTLGPAGNHNAGRDSTYYQMSIWLGSVAPTPWRALVRDSGAFQLTDEFVRAAAESAVAGATPLPGNAYKVDLVKVVVRRALERLRDMK